MFIPKYWYFFFPWIYGQPAGVMVLEIEYGLPTCCHMMMSANRSSLFPITQNLGPGALDPLINLLSIGMLQTDPFKRFSADECLRKLEMIPCKDDSFKNEGSIRTQVLCLQGEPSVVKKIPVLWLSQKHKCCRQKSLQDDSIGSATPYHDGDLLEAKWPRIWKTVAVLEVLLKIRTARANKIRCDVEGITLIVNITL